MSVKVMGAVWELELGHPEQSVLLALADHAEDDGTSVYPSVRRIAWKTGYGTRQVQRILKSLRDELGLIEVVREGGGRSNPTEYRIVLEKGVKKTPFKEWLKKGDISEKGDISAERVTSETRNHDIAMSPEPSENHHIEPPVSTDSEKPSSFQHTESQKLTNDFYNRLYGRYKIKLEKEEYEFHLGHFRNMLKKYEPDEKETLRVVAYMVDVYPKAPKVRATKAIQDVRLGRDTGEAWAGPAPWEQEKPHYAHFEDYTSTTPEERRARVKQIQEAEV